jgi:hypothetical protein
MASPVLQFRRGLFTNLPALRAGEPGFATDTSDFYIGLTSQSVNNKFFGSSRYWTKDTTTTGSAVRVVEGTNNGSDYIEIKSPDALAASITYTLPGAHGANGTVLTNDGSGNLSWVAGSINSVLSGVTTISGSLDNDANSDFSGITTFSNTTDNTLGDENTGAVQLDGGMGIAKNLTVKQNLHVGGYAEFVGVVTFRGGTINLGDADTDDIVVSGEFASSLIPTTDATYDVGGSSSKQWRHANFSGIGTFDTGVVADAIQIGITAASEIDTSAGDLTLDSAGGQVIIDDNLSVTGLSTFTGAIDANGGADISGGETTLSSATVSDLTAERVVLAGTAGSLEDSANLKYSAGQGLVVGAGGINVTGISTFSTDLVVGGDVRINGNDIQASDGNTNITLTSNTLTTFAGDIKVGGNDIQASDGNTNITMTSNTLTAVAGDLKVTGNDIQDSGGTAALTFDGSANVTANNNLTVSGNLYVNGSTTQVNTTSLTVEDSLIEVGLVDGNAPSSDLNKDLGLLLNYYDASAKKAAVYWDDSTSRIVVAAEVTESSSVLTASVYADFEIGSLYVNDCAGSSKVITCTGSERFLENITIDGGAF